MDFIQIYDNTQKTIVSLMIDSNKTLDGNYFIRSFPDAVGLIYKDKNLNRIIRSVGKQRKEYFEKNVPFFLVFQWIDKAISNAQVDQNGIVYGPFSDSKR
jgi:hypothetical protein